MERTDGQSVAARRPEPVDRTTGRQTTEGNDEVRSLSNLAAEEERSLSSGSSRGGLPRRYWSTTSVLDMAKSYSRSVMPQLLTDAEDRTLDDLEEEDSEWGGSNCESGSDDSSQDEGESGSEDEDESLFPVSQSLPELLSDLRHQSSSMPGHYGRSAVDMEHSTGLATRQNSRLLTADSIRRQLLQADSNGTSGLRRNLSIECLPSACASVDSTDTVDGVAHTTTASSSGSQCRAIYGYHLPVWSMQSSSRHQPVRRQSAISRQSNLTGDYARSPSNSVSQEAEDTFENDPGIKVAAGAMDTHDMKRNPANHRVSYILALERGVPESKKSSPISWMRKKFRNKEEKHLDNESQQGGSQTNSLRRTTGTPSSQEVASFSHPGSEESGRDLSAVQVALGRPDDFVLAMGQKAIGHNKRRRLFSAPGVGGTLNRLKLRAGQKKSQSDRRPSITDMPLDSDSSSTSVASSSDTSRTSDQLPESGENRRSNFVKRIASPILVRRWKLHGNKGSPLDRRNSSSVPSHLNTEEPSMAEPPVRPFFRSLLEIQPSHLAEELTLQDSARLQSLQPSEFENCAWISKERYTLAPNIMTMVEHFNRLALITTKEVLTPPTAEKRAKAIGHFIKVAEECLKLQNFNSLKAILAGLQCTPMFRLTKTWKELSPNKNRRFLDLADLMSETKNYTLYRARMKTALDNPPCIPFLGVFLTEVVQMDTYNKMHRTRRSSRRVSIKGRRLSRRLSKAKSIKDGVSSRRKSHHRRVSAATLLADGKRAEATSSTALVDVMETEAVTDLTPVPGDDPKDHCQCPSPQGIGPSCSLDRVKESDCKNSTPISRDSICVTLECSESESHPVSNLQPTPVSVQSAPLFQRNSSVSNGLPSPLGPQCCENRTHVSDCVQREDSAYGSGCNSRAGSATFCPQSEVSGEESPLMLSSCNPSLPASTDSSSPLADGGPQQTDVEIISTASQQAQHGPSGQTKQQLAQVVENCVSSPDCRAAEPAAATSDTVIKPKHSTSTLSATGAIDGTVTRASETLKRQVRQQSQASSDSNGSAGNIGERLTSAVGSILPGPKVTKRTAIETSVSHAGSKSLIPLGVNPRLSDSYLHTDAFKSLQGTNGLAEVNEALQSRSKSLPITCQVTPHMSLEEQLRRYKLAAGNYHHSSKPWVEYMLRTYECNTDEENYVLSCEREPRQTSPKTTSWLDRILYQQE